MLPCVRRAAAVVADISDAIGVAIGLVCVCGGGAIVAYVADGVRIRIGLIRVRRQRAIVAGVSDAVVVSIGLIAVGDCWAVVRRVDYAVAVTVRQRHRKQVESAGVGGLIVVAWSAHKERAAVGAKTGAEEIAGAAVGGELQLVGRPCAVRQSPETKCDARIGEGRVGAARPDQNDFVQQLDRVRAELIARVAKERRDQRGLNGPRSHLIFEHNRRPA